MVVKKAISFLSELAETALSNGMNTCRNTICKINRLMVYGSGEGRFKDHLKSVLKSQEILKKESIMKFKEKLLLRNRMEKDSDSICCPNCGLAFPSYYIFCNCCGTQLFDDIFDSKSSKSIKVLPKSIFDLLDISIFLNNFKLLLFLYKRFDKCLFSLTGWDNRV